MTDELISGKTEQNVQKAVLATLILLGIYFTVRFYWNVLGFIELWASDEFVDLFKALFNLIVLLLVGAVFVRQMRVLRERKEEWDYDTPDGSESEDVEPNEEAESEDTEEGETDSEDMSTVMDEEGTDDETVEDDGDSTETGDESTENELVDDDVDEDDDEVPWKQYGDVE
ncbi:MAG: hypothetical protein U5J64_08980 [Halobacteriales archaeon]|nr:hypothetical protein [Halobacteriales archaeon]